MVTFGFTEPARGPSLGSPRNGQLHFGARSEPGRLLEPDEWAAAGVPLLRDPRQVVTGLYGRHSPTPDTAVVAVFDAEERLRASASFTRVSAADGWAFRNALLSQLRRVVPHDLRRRTPARTAVLLYCREGDTRWTAEDGAWMWGLRDACTLHGLRCGAYIVLTRDGWRIEGEGRTGRSPRIGTSPAPLSETVQDVACLRPGGGISAPMRRAAAR